MHGIAAHVGVTSIATHAQFTSVATHVGVTSIAAHAQVTSVATHVGVTSIASHAHGHKCCNSIFHPVEMGYHIWTLRKQSKIYVLDNSSEMKTISCNFPFNLPDFPVF